MSTGVSSKGKGREQPIASLLAGATAGGIEGFVTFPLESLKTQVQFGTLVSENGKVCPRDSRQVETSAEVSPAIITLSSSSPNARSTRIERIICGMYGGGHRECGESWSALHDV